MGFMAHQHKKAISRVSGWKGVNSKPLMPSVLFYIEGVPDIILMIFCILY